MVIQEISKNLFRLVIPLALESLKSVNIYAIKGREVSLLVDAGSGSDSIFFEFLLALKSIQIDLNRTFVFITHFHIDHFGFAKRLLSEGARLLICDKDWERAKRIKNEVLKKELKEFFSFCGHPENNEDFGFFEEVDKIYGLEDTSRVKFLEGNERIAIDDYTFFVLDTPGHTSGHMTLYEPSLRLYFSGDHILKQITPTIQARSLSENPLQDYLESLRKISRLPINYVLPSHGDPFAGAKERIRELINHHKRRLRDVVFLLGEKKSIFELASQMQWETDVADFHDLPIIQRLFAMGEALAHVNYLMQKGIVGFLENSVPKFFVKKKE